MIPGRRTSFVVAVVFAFVLAACGGSESSVLGFESATSAPTQAEPASDRSEAQEPDLTDPGLTDADRSVGNSAPSGPSTPENPWPIVGATFTHEDLFGPATFDGELMGVVEVPVTDLAEEDGRCYVVLGSITPTAVENRVSSNFDPPNISLLVNGVMLDEGISECDESAVEAAGYSWILRASTTVGTSYAFFETIFVPSISPRDPAAVVVGRTNSDDLLYFKPTILPEIPEPPAPTYGPNEFLESAESMVGNQFTTTVSFAGATWDGEFIALVESGLRPSVEEEGRCVFVLGTVTLTGLDEEKSTGPPTIPGTFLVIDGRVTPSVGGKCDPEVVQTAGWGWSLTRDIELGTPVSFYSGFLLSPNRPNVINAVGIGVPVSDDALFFLPAEIQNNVPRAK